MTMKLIAIFFLFGKSSNIGNLVVGWDHTVDPSGATQMMANVSANDLSGIMAWDSGNGWVRFDRGSDDLTFGPVCPGAIESTDLVTGAFANSVGDTALALTYTVVNNGTAAWSLEQFCFDAWRTYLGACSGYTLSVIKGDLTLTNNFASGGFVVMNAGPTSGANVDYQDVLISLTNLPDHELASGESVTFRLELLDESAYNASFYLDNVGICGASNGISSLAAPSGLWAVTNGSTKADLEWDSVPGATFYDVFRNGDLIGTTSSLTVMDNGPLGKYDSYGYSVRAGNSATNSVASEVFIYAYCRFPFVMPWDNCLSNSVAKMDSSLPIYRVSVDGDHLEANGLPIQFLGVNMGNAASLPPADDSAYGNVAEKLAARMEALGVNCVRLHGFDRLASAGLGLFEDDWKTINFKQNDFLDYFIWRLKEHGIYVNLSLQVARDYPGYSKTNFLGNGMFKGVDLYMPDLIEYQKDFASDLLTHTNMYTGLTYADDPVIAIVGINNENGLIDQWKKGLFSAGIDSIYCDELKLKWNDWLARKYDSNTVILAQAWASDTTGSSFGEELIDDGEFSETNSWVVQVNSPADATSQISFAEAPDGSNALEVDVTTASTDLWKVQVFQQLGASVVSGDSYTVSFWAKADSNRTATIGLVDAYTWSALGAKATVALGTQWRQYTVVLAATNSAGVPRITMSDLAGQTGTLWLAHFSLQTGDGLLGPEWTLPEGQLGSEKLVNGDFSAGFVVPWVGRASSPTSASFEITNNALRVHVTSADVSSPSKVQFFQQQQSTVSGKSYTLIFSAKSDVPREIQAGLTRGTDPWGKLSNMVFLNIDDSWHDFTVILTALETETIARLTITDLASATGDIWFSNISLREGLPLGEGLLGGEVLGGVNIIARERDLLSRTRAVKYDWMEFLWDTETNYWGGMYNYLKNDLGVGSLLLGTQSLYSPSLIQGDLDIVDIHQYWQHPVFLGLSWDSTNWVVRNQPMSGGGDGGFFAKQATTRVVGKPFICSEYNHPFPNTYGTEAFLVAPAYAAMQGWDGFYVFDYLHEPLWNTEYARKWFQIAQEPAKLVTLRAAAAMLNGAVSGAATNLTSAIVNKREALAALIKGDWPLSATSFGLQRSVALSNPVGLCLGDLPQVCVPFEPTNGIWQSTTGELMWNSVSNFVTVDTSEVKVLIGRTQQASYTFSQNIVIQSGSTMQSGDWAAISLTLCEGDGFESSSNRILLTATGYADNYLMKWQAGKGPEDATSSVGDDWGQAPSLLEGIDANIKVPCSSGCVMVWALDGTGQRMIQVPVSYAGGQAVFDISHEYKTLWYEIQKTAD